MTNKEYYQNNKDKWAINTEEKRLRKIENQKRYMEKHKEKVKKYKNKWTENNYEWVLFNLAKNRSKRNGIEFNLELSDIVIPSHCKYLGIPLTKGWGKGIQLSNASIDRIDNTKGYTKDNIQIISRQANEMKRQSSIEDLIKFAKGVLDVHGK